MHAAKSYVWTAFFMVMTAAVVLPLVGTSETVTVAAVTGIATVAAAAVVIGRNEQPPAP